MVCAPMVCWVCEPCTSTIGDSPVTVMVSATSPTLMLALTDAVKEPVSSIPSRRTGPKPLSSNLRL